MKTSDDDMDNFFQILVNGITDPDSRKSAEDLLVCGGTLPIQKMPDLLTYWRNQIGEPVTCFYETVDEIRFGEPDTLPDSPVDRLVLFNEKGSLNMRRTGDHYVWHMLADKADCADGAISNEQVDADLSGIDFWATPQEGAVSAAERKNPMFLHSREHVTMLWGKQIAPGLFREERMAAARSLNYPVASEGHVHKDHARLLCTIYSYAGQTCFIRYRKLEEC